MKEAAGEANMTVITIVLIAIVLGAGTLIVTNMMNGMKNNNQNKCVQLGGAWNGSQCTCPDNTTRAVNGTTGQSCSNNQTVNFET